VVKKQRLWEAVLIGGAVIALIASLIPLYSELLNPLMRESIKMGMGKLMLSNAFLYSSIFGLFLGMFTLISSFFFSKETAALIPLPLKPAEVLCAKLFTVTIDQLVVSLFMLAPVIVLYGINSNMRAGYYITGIIVFLFSQLFPMLLVSIIIFPLSSVVKFNKNKDFMIFFISTVVLVGVIFGQYYLNQFAMNQTTAGLSSQDMAKLLADPDMFINKISMAYPPAFLALNALTRSGVSGILWLLSYIGVHLAAFLLVLWLADRFYFSTYSELQENAAGKKKLSDNEFEKVFSVKSTVYHTLMKREWRYFLRVPAFSFNGLANVVIFPILLIVFAAGAYNVPEIQALMIFIDQYKELVVPVGSLLAALAGSMSLLPASAFSREGKLLRELKTLPVSPTDVIKVKFVHSNLISGVGVFCSAIAVGFITKIGWLEVLWIIVTGYLLTIFLNNLQMIVDTAKPMLEWDNPIKAMKQNINGLLAIAIVFGFVFGLGYLGYVTREYIPNQLMNPVLMLIGIAGSLFTWKALLTQAQKLFEKDL
jgi:ABC-2 type transport system permease protein